MKKFGIVKQAKVVNVAVAVCVAIAGIILLIFPNMGIENEKILFGIMCILLGCSKMVGYFSNDMYRLAFQFDFAIGIFAALIGILAFIGPESIVQSLPTVIAAYVILDGTLKLQTGIDAKRFGITKWFLIIITAATVCILGTAAVVFLYTPVQLPVFLAVALIADGCENAWITAYTVRVRAMKKSVTFDSENE